MTILSGIIELHSEGSFEERHGWGSDLISLELEELLNKNISLAFWVGHAWHLGVWWVLNSFLEFNCLCLALLINSAVEPVKECDTIVKLLLKKLKGSKCILDLLFAVFWDEWDDDSSIKEFNIRLLELGPESSGEVNFGLSGVVVEEV